MWQRPRGVSPRLFVVLLGVVLISAVVFSWLVSTGRVGGRAWSVFETNRSLGVKLGDRWWVGIDTLHMARSHPWVGVGVGCFECVFPNYLTYPMDLHWIHAHDDIFEAAAETGLPGVVIMVVAIVLFFRMAFGQIEGRLRHGWGWIQIGAAVGALGLFFHSFVDFNLRVPANAAWFVVCLAIATPLWSCSGESAGRSLGIPTPTEIANSSPRGATRVITSLCGDFGDSSPPDSRGVKHKTKGVSRGCGDVHRNGGMQLEGSNPGRWNRFPAVSH